MGQLDRLDEEALRARLHRAHRIRHIAMAGNHDDNRSELANALEHIEAAEIGETQVEQHEVRMRALNGGDSFLAAVGAHHLGTRGLEEGGGRRGDRRLAPKDTYAWKYSCDGV